MNTRRILPAWRWPLARVTASWRALAGLLALGTLLLVFLEWFDPFYFTYDDNATQLVPWLVHNYRSLVHEGEFAWMNFHQYLGHPHFVAAQSGVFYWPNYLCGWLAEKGLGLLPAVGEVTTCLHWLAGLASTFVFLRILKVSSASLPRTPA